MIVAIVGISGFLAIGALGMICWFVFNGNSTSDGTASETAKVSDKSKDSKRNVLKFGGDPESVKAHLKNKLANLPPEKEPGDRLAPFKKPGDHPYGKVPRQIVSGKNGGMPKLIELDEAIYGTVFWLTNDLEYILRGTRTTTDPISARKSQSDLGSKFGRVIERFRELNEMISRSSRIVNGTIHNEFGDKLSSAIESVHSENQRVSELLGLGDKLFERMDTIDAQYKKFLLLTKERAVPVKDESGFFTAVKVNSEFPIDPVFESNYAEIRISGLYGKEESDMVKRRIREIHPFKKHSYIEAYGFPLRIVIWPVDSIDLLAAKIDFGDVLHVEGKEIWVWPKSFNELRTQRSRIHGEEPYARESDGNAPSETGPPLDPVAMQEAHNKRMDAAHEKIKELRAKMTERKANFGSRSGIGSRSGMERPERAGSDVPKSAARDDGPGTDRQATSRPAQGSATTGERSKNAAETEVDFALERLRSNDSEKRTALGTLSVIDLEGREAEVVAALRPVIGASNSWALSEEILGVLDRCPGPDRAEMVIASLGDKTITNRSYIRALGRWKDPRAIEPIANQLSDLGTRTDAARALTSFGPEAEKAVLKQLTSPDQFTRRAVWEILARIGGDETISVYRKLKAARTLDSEAENAVAQIRDRQRQKTP